MAAEPCKNCGNLRKVDVVWTPDGWVQPQCYHCGDPEYFEPHQKPYQRIYQSKEQS